MCKQALTEFYTEKKSTKCTPDGVYKPEPPGKKVSNQCYYYDKNSSFKKC